MEKNVNTATTYSSSGRRKASVARAHLTRATNDEAKITVNDLPLEQYFDDGLLINNIKIPLEVTDNLNNYNVKLNVNGGGKTGQSGAARLAIANALLKISTEYRLNLKQAKLLTVDARIKERKKTGLRGARKRAQFSKR